MTGYNSSLLYISGQLGVHQPHRGSAQALGGLRRLQHQRVSLRGRGTQRFLTIVLDNCLCSCTIRHKNPQMPGCLLGTAAGLLILDKDSPVSGDPCARFHYWQIGGAGYTL